MSSTTTPSIRSARTYITTVKRTLGPTSPRYRAFLGLLKNYQSQQITSRDVIERISELFRGHYGLMLGFSVFVPREEREGVVRAAEAQQREHERYAAAGKVFRQGERRSQRRKEIDEVDDEEEDDDDGMKDGSRQRGGGGGGSEEDSYEYVDDLSVSTGAEESDEYDNMEVDEYETDDDEDIGDIQGPPEKRARFAEDGSVLLPHDIMSHPNKQYEQDVPDIKVPPKMKVTKIKLMPLPSQAKESSLLYNYDPLTPEGMEQTHGEFVHCKLCRGKRNGIATVNDEPVLLCEQDGCNAEYHLKCLPPSAFGSKKKELSEVPDGEIYCQDCATDGSTSVLRQYFERCDHTRSHYTCSRAYVLSLLENHMKDNPDGNLIENNATGAAGKNLIDIATGEYDVETGEMKMKKVRMLPPPRSELWSVGEMNRLALLNPNASDDGDIEGSDNDEEKEVTERDSAEFLVGKPIRLYCNLDNEYHNGRIVDWRRCTAYPEYDYTELDKRNRTTAPVDMLEFYGVNHISQCEYLVRFPAGIEGRKKELLQWIILEEHSIAVGISLIRGQTVALKTRIRGWKPAMIFARSALELVAVRSELHEGERGELFATMEREESMKSSPAKERQNAGPEKWGLAVFFGGDAFALLCLRDEAQDLITSDMHGDNTNGDAVEGGAGKEEQLQDKDAPESEDDDWMVRDLKQHTSSSLPLKLGLAMVEYNEQQRVKNWYRRILQNPSHRLALTSADEYSMEVAMGNIIVNEEKKNIINTFNSDRDAKGESKWKETKATKDAKPETKESADSDNVNATNKGCKIPTVQELRDDKTIPKNLPDGATELKVAMPQIGPRWELHILRRKTDQNSAKTFDRFFVTPGGKRLRSFIEVVRFLRSANENAVKKGVVVKKKETPKKDTYEKTVASASAETPDASGGETTAPTDFIIERGVDRLWLAHLVERISPPLEQTKDCLMSFDCAPVPSAAEGMIALQELATLSKERDATIAEDVSDKEETPVDNNVESGANESMQKDELMLEKEEEEAAELDDNKLSNDLMDVDDGAGSNANTETAEDGGLRDATQNEFVNGSVEMKNANEGELSTQFDATNATVSSKSYADEKRVDEQDDGNFSISSEEPIFVQGGTVVPHPTWHEEEVEDGSSNESDSLDDGAEAVFYESSSSEISVVSESLRSLNDSSSDLEDDSEPEIESKDVHGIHSAKKSKLAYAKRPKAVKSGKLKHASGSKAIAPKSKLPRDDRVDDRMARVQKKVLQEMVKAKPVPMLTESVVQPAASTRKRTASKKKKKKKPQTILQAAMAATRDEVEWKDDEEDIVELPRGVTQRPSGKWQAQLYYAVNYQEVPAEDVNRNIDLARKLACAGV
ncbi:predicted protein [Thalassiosira pseudonana CCMP1335]|uniref:MBD domain-containing protein n=1 Tax=Thalassiosira pseudonana TaxID=35128 RepID=B8C5Q4_THAPS|nr:predicted protein [Thalassiosira pseudonana CCMP1335]EED91547.1 predicted protein [Thalassiosira pseudonana CCMP1335]